MNESGGDVEQQGKDRFLENGINKISSPEKINLLRHVIGTPAIEYLRKTGHTIYDRPENLIPTQRVFAVRDAKRVVEFHLGAGVVGGLRNQWVKPERRSLEMGFSLEDDYLRDIQRGNGSGEVRPSSYNTHHTTDIGTTLHFFKFLRGLIGQITDPRIDVVALTPERYALYEEMIKKIGNPQNIHLIARFPLSDDRLG